MDNKVFHGIRGTAPYYLDIPSFNSIFFVTEEAGSRETFHVFDLSTKRDLQIDGGTSGFGWEIGANRKLGDKFTDYIESANSNRIIIVIRSDNWKETMSLNLPARTIEERETLRFDSSGSVTNRSIQTNVFSHFSK